MKFKPEDFHEIYLQTAKRLGWPIRPAVDVPYDQLSDEAKALDIALVEHCHAKLKEWLEEAPTVYGQVLSGVPKNFGSQLFMRKMNRDTHKAKLVCIEDIKEPFESEVFGANLE